MTKYLIDGMTLTALGDAIRVKTGESNMLSPTEMVTAIQNIETGSGGSSNDNLGVVNVGNKNGETLQGTFYYDKTKASIIKDINFVFSYGKNTMNPLIEINGEKYFVSTQALEFDENEQIGFYGSLVSKNDNIPLYLYTYPHACFYLMHLDGTGELFYNKETISNIEQLTFGDLEQYTWVSAEHPTDSAYNLIFIGTGGEYGNGVLVMSSTGKIYDIGQSFDSFTPGAQIFGTLIED